jgi:hypothetical protein
VQPLVAANLSAEPKEEALHRRNYFSRKSYRSYNTVSAVQPNHRPVPGARVRAVGEVSEVVVEGNVVPKADSGGACVQGGGVQTVAGAGGV